MDAQERQDDNAFLRQCAIPEEERAKYTTQPWAGEYRWFRSPNVICLEPISAAHAGGCERIVDVEFEHRDVRPT
jgi:hypothetical protein